MSYIYYRLFPSHSVKYYLAIEITLNTDQRLDLGSHEGVDFQKLFEDVAFWIYQDEVRRRRRAMIP